MPTFHHEHALQVQTAVGSLRESAVNRTSHLQKEISTAQDLTSSVREKWGFYMEETEKNYTEDTKAVDSGRSCLAEVLVEWSVHFSVMPCDGGYSFWFEDADVLNFFFLPSPGNLLQQGEGHRGCTAMEERGGFSVQPRQRKRGISGFYSQVISG
jgi:hypothetical protein